MEARDVETGRAIDLVEENAELQRLLGIVSRAKQEWERTMDCVDQLVLLVDNGGRIKRCNRAFKEFTSLSYQELIGAEIGLLLDQFEIGHGESGEHGVVLFHTERLRWFVLQLYDSASGGSDALGTVLTVHDITEIRAANAELDRKNLELTSAYEELKETQARVLQQEKMASVGFLAAGVAHEINNPTGFILSNLGTLEKYAERLGSLVQAQRSFIAALPGPPAGVEELEEQYRKGKIDFILDDLKNLLRESTDGALRVKEIVKDLKIFSRTDEGCMQRADINGVIQSTLNMAWNEIKYKATLEKEFGDIPEIPCYAQKLSQVFMNLLVNAAQAIERQGVIRIRTWQEKEAVLVAISDTGCGMPTEVQKRIFEPFFTTKPVGQGTGLGMSISFEIIKKHRGEIRVESRPGEGTTFTIRLPFEATA